MQLNNTINFRDLTGPLINNKFEFNIYMKPTQTDSIIPYDSQSFFYTKYNHEFNIKHVSFLKINII